MEINVDPEIQREKIFILSEMSTKEIIQKYSISKSCAERARKRGWFVKNYSRNQVIIDREHFDPALSYSIAKQVFWKKFRRNPLALSIKEDMIQEAVSLMFMQSGKINQGANKKYNNRYGFWWCTYNAMIAYLSKWIRQTRYDIDLEDEIHPIMHQDQPTFHVSLKLEKLKDYAKIY
jgi:hypothetical protein